MSGTDLLGRVYGFLILAGFLNVEGLQTSLMEFSSHIKKTGRDWINIPRQILMVKRKRILFSKRQFQYKDLKRK